MSVPRQASADHALTVVLHDFRIAPVKPADYFREIVEPTIGEFIAEPKDVRRAYLACVVTFHFADAAAVHTKRKPHQVEDELKGLAPDF